MEIEISFYGLSSHGSAPERGKNAIYIASNAALEIEKLNDLGQQMTQQMEKLNSQLKETRSIQDQVILKKKNSNFDAN